MPMSGYQFVEWLDHELEPLRREVIASPTTMFGAAAN
jgi:hypothetical protein